MSSGVPWSAGRAGPVRERQPGAHRARPGSTATSAPPGLSRRAASWNTGPSGRWKTTWWSTSRQAGSRRTTAVRRADRRRAPPPRRRAARPTEQEAIIAGSRSTPVIRKAGLGNRWRPGCHPQPTDRTSPRTAAGGGRGSPAPGASPGRSGPARGGVADAVQQVVGRVGLAHRAPGAHDRRDRLEQDRQVEEHRPALQVEEVEPHELVEVELGAARDLPQAGHAGQDEVALAVPVVEAVVVSLVEAAGRPATSPRAAR